MAKKSTAVLDTRGMGRTQAAAVGKIAKNADTRAVYEEALPILREGIANDIERTYNFMSCLARVRDEAKYGSGAVTLLATAFNRDPSYISRGIKVVDVFTEAEIKEFIKLVQSGRQLTWSHLLKLSTITSPKERNRLLTMVLNKGVSTARLQDIKNRAGTAQDTSAGQPPSRRAVSLLSSLAHMAQRFEARLGEELEGDLFGTLESLTPDDVDDSTLRRIDNSLAELDRLGALLGSRCQQVRSARERLTPAGVAEAVNQEEPETAAAAEAPAAEEPEVPEAAASAEQEPVDESGEPRDDGDGADPDDVLPSPRPVPRPSGTPTRPKTKPTTANLKTPTLW